MESYNITVRYIGLGAIGVAALALIVAALARREPLPPAVARGTAGQRDKVTRHPGLTLVREVAA